MDFWRAVEVLGKRKWLILACVVTTTILTFGATRLIGSKWTATVQFLSTPEQNVANPYGVESHGPEGHISRVQAEIYLNIVKSRPVLQRALKSLGMSELPGDLLENLKFEATGSKMFTLQVSNSNPEIAKRYANALAESFVEQNRELYSEQAQRLVNQTQAEYNKSRSQHTVALRRLDRYKRQHSIVGGGVADTYSQPLMAKSTAMASLAEARGRKAEIEARINAQRYEMQLIPELVPYEVAPDESPTLKQLLQEKATYETKLTTLMSRYTDEHIEVKQVRATLALLDARIEAERKGIGRGGRAERLNPAREEMRVALAQARAELSAVNARIGSLDSDVRKAQSELDVFPGLDTQLEVLMGEVAEKAEGASQVRTRMTAAEQALDAARSQNPIVIMDRVQEFNPPVNATAGRTKKLIALAFVCSLIGACALVLAFDIVDRRVRTVEQAELVLPAPVLTAIPAPVGSVTAGTLARAAELHPLSPHSEAYRFLAVHLLSPANRDIRSIMVLSAKNDQGSTSTVTNLGITLAQAGQRVIIVDANIRAPRVHEVFDTSNDYGFTTLVKRPDAEAFERALRPTSVPNLRVICSGPAPNNPWELFRSQNLLEVASRLKDMADFVLFDTPSAVAFTDVLNLTAITDGAFLCVRALEAPSGAEARLVEMLEKADVKILGSVLSDVPASVLDSYQSYQQYYALPTNGHANGANGSKTALPSGNGNGAHASRVTGYVVPGEEA